MNERKYKPTFLCKRWRMLDYLVGLGYQPIKTLPDCTNPRYNVWVFENTGPEFEQAVTEYFESTKRYCKQ